MIIKYDVILSLNMNEPKLLLTYIWNILYWFDSSEILKFCSVQVWYKLLLSVILLVLAQVSVVSPMNPILERENRKWSGFSDYFSGIFCLYLKVKD